MTPQSFHFDAAYQEDVTLGDGARIRLRLLRPGDRDRLREGFERLSPESRYLRFMGSKAELSERELTALTELDGLEHFALGAARLGADGEVGEGVGVARFIRHPDDPETAEAAVTVLDALQGRGLGTVLLRRLAAAARERGVRRFAGEILAANEAMWQLLTDHVSATVLERSGETVQVVVDLPPYGALMSPDHEGHLLERLLAFAADGRLTLRMNEALLKRR